MDLGADNNNASAHQPAPNNAGPANQNPANNAALANDVVPAAGPSNGVGPTNQNAGDNVQDISANPVMAIPANQNLPGDTPTCGANQDLAGDMLAANWNAVPATSVASGIGVDDDGDELFDDDAEYSNSPGHGNHSTIKSSTEQPSSPIAMSSHTTLSLASQTLDVMRQQMPSSHQDDRMILGSSSMIDSCTMSESHSTMDQTQSSTAPRMSGSDDEEAVVNEKSVVVVSGARSGTVGNKGYASGPELVSYGVVVEDGIFYSAQSVDIEMIDSVSSRDESKDMPSTSGVQTAIFRHDPLPGSSRIMPSNMHNTAELSTPSVDNDVDSPSSKRPRLNDDNPDLGRHDDRKSSGVAAIQGEDNMLLATTDSRKARNSGKSLRGRKKGLVKRAGLPRFVNQSCQAVSEEIRETTKKVQDPPTGAIPAASSTSESPSTSATSHLDSSHLVLDSPVLQSASSNGTPLAASGKRLVRRVSDIDENSDTQSATTKRKCKAPKRKPDKKDKATSTSDPVLEDDHSQVCQPSLTLKVFLFLNRPAVPRSNS